MKNQFAVFLLSAVLATGVVPAYVAIGQASPSPQIIAQAEAREKIAAEFIDLLVKGDTRSALEKYDSTVRENISLQSLGDMWGDLINETGPFEKTTGIRSEANLVIVSCEFEKSKRDLLIIFNDSNNIVGLDYVQPQ
ncbi:MAG: hypothetical protein Fur0025_27490 [Oscillatoriaceae cyanobacterium]